MPLSMGSQIRLLLRFTSVKYQSNINAANSVTTLVGDGVEYAFDNDVRPLGGTHPAPAAPYFTFVSDTEVPVHYSVEGTGTLSIQQGYGA